MCVLLEGLNALNYQQNLGTASRDTPHRDHQQQLHCMTGFMSAEQHSSFSCNGRALTLVGLRCTPQQQTHMTCVLSAELVLFSL